WLHGKNRSVVSLNIPTRLAARPAFEGKSAVVQIENPHPAARARGIAHCRILSGQPASRLVDLRGPPIPDSANVVAPFKVKDTDRRIGHDDRDLLVVRELNQFDLGAE